MKKLLITLLLLVSVAASLFAYTSFPDFFYPSTSFRPISPRVEAMGGAGLATVKGADAFFWNPANLSSKQFTLNLPSVGVSLYNPKAIIDSGIIEKIQEDGNMQTIPIDYFKIVTAGDGEILTTDLAFSLSGGGFGFGVQVQEALHTTSFDGQLANDKIIAEVNLGAALGLGFRFNVIPKWLSIDAGVTARLSYKAYTNRIGASELISLFDEDGGDPLQTILKDQRLAAGVAMPIDIGVNLNLPIGLRVSAVARDINATYSMINYKHAGTWLNEIMALVGAEDLYTGDEGDLDEFTVTVPWKLDFGIGWTPHLGSLSRLLQPSIALDFVDMAKLLENPEENQNAFLDHMRVGAELKLFSMVDLRAGLNRGYMSVGVGLDLFVFHIDAAYYWREAGTDIGDKPMDALSLRFNLGFDR